MAAHDEPTANLHDAPADAKAPPEAAGRGHEGIEDVLVAWVETLSRREAGAGQPTGLPVLPAPPPEAAGKTDERLGRLRRFHAGDPDAGAGLQEPGDDVLPALLAPFRDPKRVRHDYPLFLDPPGAGRNGRFAAPLSEVLRQLVAGIGPGPEDARALKDNLPRLERCVREALDGAGPPADAAELLSHAAKATEETLGLGGSSGQCFHDDLQKLLQSVPAGGSLLALGDHTPLLLLLHAACDRAEQRRSALHAEITTLRNRLRDLQRLDDTRRTGDGRPEALTGSLGAAALTHVDADALARMVGKVGGAPMPADRRERLRAAIETFERYLADDDEPLVLVAHHEPVAESCHRRGVVWRPLNRADVCREAAALFDGVADRYSQLFGAMRLARLELDGAYDPSRHDGLRASFDWRSFSPAELLSLPPVLVAESAQHLAGAGMLDLSRLLLSGRPVNVLVIVQPATNPGLAPGQDPLTGYRFELSYLGVSHRDALVNQTSAARPDHLVAGFRRGLDATRAALHVVASGLTADGGDPPLGAWLHGGAALESRAHPFFHYDPEAGETWARRLDFSTNPQPESDWPAYTLPCAGEDGSRRDLDVAFTFADFALMEPAYRCHFRVIPNEIASEELVTLDAYLVLPPPDAHDRIPFIHAVDGDNRVQRLAVTRQLAFACRDRLDYWHTLQELAGVRNEYVREALQRQREQMEAEFAAEREALREAHTAAVEQAETAAAGDAMRRLAEALLATDISSLAAESASAPPRARAAVPRPAPAAPAETADTPAPPPEPVAAEPEPTEPEEPWIDTLLCTSCNDCLDIHPTLFVYNANKQAVIGDVGAGTFEQLVRAAEKCPARCIHPGTPMNPDEPNLEALIDRAKPFNV